MAKLIDKLLGTEYSLPEQGEVIIGKGGKKIEGKRVDIAIPSVEALEHLEFREGQNYLGNEKYGDLIQRISPKHFIISVEETPEGAAYFIRNVSPKGSLSVNKKPVAYGKKLSLPNGAEIDVAGYKLVFQDGFYRKPEILTTVTLEEVFCR